MIGRGTTSRDPELQQTASPLGRLTMLKIVSAMLVSATLVSVPAAAQNAPSTNTPARAPQAQAQQNASELGLWQGSKLIGVNVYNGQNEKIGDIKDVLIDKNGRVGEIVIGVGGFLGMGEHDVAVEFSELKWSNDPVRTATSSSANTQTTGTATSNTSMTDQKKNYPDHAVLSATKDQLKAMPQFNYNK
jgi:hypothetical protein